MMLNSFSIAPKNGSEEENDDTVINLVHRIAHEHLVGAKAVYGPKCIAHEMPSSQFATIVVPLNLWADPTTAAYIQLYNSLVLRPAL